MKSVKNLSLLLVLIIVGCANNMTKSNRTIASAFNAKIRCFGLGEIQGTFRIKKKETVFLFNSTTRHNPDYVSSGENGVQTIYGHRVELGNKDYYHDPTLANCKDLDTGEIECNGSGVGNGPSLKVTINLSNRTGHGSYFNPWAKRGISTPNDYNTYQYKNLECEEI